MATTTKAGKRPMCSGARKDGSACNSYAQASGLCSHHERRAAEQACVPAAAIPATAEDSGEGLTPEPDQASERRGRQVAPTSESVREAFRQDAAANYQVMVDALLEGLQETNTVFVTCPNCQKRLPHQAPALAGRVKAVETLISLGFGKPPEQQKPTTDVDPVIAEIEAMTPERLEVRSLVLLVSFVEDRALKTQRAELTAEEATAEAAEVARNSIRETVTALLRMDALQAEEVYAELDQERRKENGSPWSSYETWFH